MNHMSISGNSSMEKAVSAVVSDFHSRGFFPSATVRVFTGTDTLCTVSVGGVNPDTVFDVASLSKIATATQVLQAIADGKLRLSDEIVDVLPALWDDDYFAGRLSKVTIEKLLTHTSSIVDWYPFYAEKGDFADVLGIALRRYGPVEGMVYSDLNFMLLGNVLEVIHGYPLDDCLSDMAISMDLGRMTYHPDPSWDIAPSSYGNPIEERMCAERGITFDRWRPHEPVIGKANDGNAYYYFGGVAGSAGVFADTLAYQQLCQFHMTTDIPVMIDAQREHASTRGLGWQLGEMYPDGCGHTGFTGTSMYLSRKRNIGVVAFTNRLFYKEENKNPTNEFRRALHEAVCG